MTEREKQLAACLIQGHSLSEAEYAELIRGRDPETAQMLAEAACAVRKTMFGDAVYTRGLIEISSICKNNCLYCGIRRDNTKAERYRLTEEEILSCADEGYMLGFRTFVLQGGEDPYFTDAALCGLVNGLKTRHPDCAVTLSMGERSRESYQALYDAGADRYLLRHETADAGHYARLHPPGMSFGHRMNCLRELKEIGYQTGCGFMVGSPFQTPETLAKDLKFVEEFRPAMCGIGPFIPHRNTPFRDEPSGTLELTLFLLSTMESGRRKGMNLKSKCGRISRLRMRENCSRACWNICMSTETTVNCGRVFRSSRMERCSFETGVPVSRLTARRRSVI